LIRCAGIRISKHWSKRFSPRKQNLRNEGKFSRRTGLRAFAASFLLSYVALKLHPLWDPLRGGSRFERIVQSLAPK
jgi:hypothetical protein